MPVRVRPVFSTAVLSATSAAYYQLPTDRSLPWAGAGVPGGIPNYTSVYLPNGDPYGGYSVDPALGNNSTDATSAIQTALNNAAAVASAGSPKVVLLAAGNYKTTNQIWFGGSYTCLRGSGLTATGPATKISLLPAGQALRVFLAEGSTNFSVGDNNYQSGWTTLSANVSKGSYTVSVTSATGFSVGDLVTIDQTDDTAYVDIGDGSYWKRGPGGNPGSSVFRSMGQTNKITAINGTTFTLEAPMYRNFDTTHVANIWKFTPMKGVGCEDIGITGAGGGTSCMEFSFCENSWMKNVETNGDPNAWSLGGPGSEGHMLRTVNSFHCEVRRCYVHGAKGVNPGGNAYGITIVQYSSKCLIEDSIAYNEDKPICLINTGGGNVVGYNYADQAIIDYQLSWQENTIDACHTSFSHDDLIEGNFSPTLGGDSTHGNSGWAVFFRNRATGRNSDGVAYQNVQAAAASGRSHYYSFVGNVLGPTGTIPNLQSHAPMYENYRTEPGHVEIGDGIGWAMWRIGRDPVPSPPPDWDDGEAKAELLRHGNYDEYTDSIADWIVGQSQNLPNSFYLSAKPSFFGSNTWPWVVPTGATSGDREKILPAKARYDAGTPFA